MSANKASMVVHCLARSLLWGYMTCATEEGRGGVDMRDNLGEWWEGEESRLERLAMYKRRAHEPCKGKRRMVTGEGNESQPRVHKKDMPYYITLQ